MAILLLSQIRQLSVLEYVSPVMKLMVRQAILHLLRAARNSEGIDVT